ARNECGNSAGTGVPAQIGSSVAVSVSIGAQAYTRKMTDWISASAQDAVQAWCGVERAAVVQLEAARLARILGDGADAALEPVGQGAPVRQRVGDRQARDALRTQGQPADVGGRRDDRDGWRGRQGVGV